MKNKVKLFLAIAKELNIGQYELVIDGKDVLVYSIDRETKDRNKTFHGTEIVATAINMHVSCYVNCDTEGYCHLTCF